MGNKIICSSTVDDEQHEEPKGQTKSSSSATTARSRSRLLCPAFGKSKKSKTKSPCYLVSSNDWPYVWAIRDVSVLDKIWKQSLTNMKQEINEIECKQHDLPKHIFKNIYLGNANSVQDIDKLQSLKIKRVLNMAGPYAVKKGLVREMKHRGITYKCIDAHDEEGYPILKRHWLDAHEFIHNTCSSSSRNNSTAVGSIDSCCCQPPQHNSIFNSCFGSTDDAVDSAAINGNVADNNVTSDPTKNDDTKDVDDGEDNILIHCIAGQNRSVLIVAIEYMLSTGSNVLETMLYIRKIRGISALNNESFQEQLISFAKQNDLLGPIPGSMDCIVQQVAPKPNWKSNFHETFSMRSSSSNSSHSNNDDCGAEQSNRSSEESDHLNKEEESI